MEKIKINGEYPLTVVESNYINPMEFWYDWFCADRYLQVKGQKLMGKLIEIINSPKFDKAQTYTFFKNNCPMVGRLYDDFRICDINTGDVLFTICNPEPNKWCVYCKGHWREPIISGGWKKVSKWFYEDAEGCD